MIAISERTRWFYTTRMRHNPTTYAMMQPPGSPEKYLRLNRPPTIDVVRRHLLGEITIACPVVVDGMAHEIVFDVDRGGLPVIWGVMEEVQNHGLFCYGVYTPRKDRGAIDQRGYVYVPFEGLAPAVRFSMMASKILSQGHFSDGVENRVSQADTRLFWGKHTHTGKWGELHIQRDKNQGAWTDIDRNPVGAFDWFREWYQENPLSLLPEEPEGGGEAAPRRSTPANDVPQLAAGGIDEFNRATDLESLLRSAGARQVRPGLFFCPFHQDEHASLTVFRSRAGKGVARCLSERSACPLSGPPHDAFDIFCIMHRLSAAEGLRRLRAGAAVADAGRLSPPPSGSSGGEELQVVAPWRYRRHALQREREEQRNG